MILFAIVLLLAGCGEQYKAKKAVKAFLKDNLTESSFSTWRFSDVDSTQNVTPEQVTSLRRATASLKHFKSGVNYAPYTKKAVLKYERFMLKANDDTLHCTAYFNADINQVVAFKAY